MGIFRNKLSEYLPAYVPRPVPLSRRNEYQADATAALWVGIGLYKQALYRLHQINDQLKPPRKFLAKLGTHPTMQERLERVGVWNSALRVRFPADPVWFLFFASVSEVLPIAG